MEPVSSSDALKASTDRRNSRAQSSSTGRQASTTNSPLDYNSGLEKAFLILPSVSTVLPKFYDAIFGHHAKDVENDDCEETNNEDWIPLPPPPPQQQEKVAAVKRTPRRSFDAISLDFSLGSSSNPDGLDLSPPDTSMFLSPLRRNGDKNSNNGYPIPLPEINTSSPCGDSGGEAVRNQQDDTDLLEDILDNNNNKDLEEEVTDFDMWSDLDDATMSQQAHNKDDASLGAVARRFHALLKSREDGRLHIDEAAASLGKPRRRIYDVIHVLWAAGWIYASKGWVYWDTQGTIGERKRSLEQELADLELEDNRLAEQIEALKSKQQKCSSRHQFIRYSDINRLREFDESNVLVVNTPRSLEVAHPSKEMPFSGKRFRLSLSNRNREKNGVESLTCPFTTNRGFSCHDSVDEEHRMKFAKLLITPIRIFLVKHSPLTTPNTKKPAIAKKVTPVKTCLDFKDLAIPEVPTRRNEVDGKPAYIQFAKSKTPSPQLYPPRPYVAPAAPPPPYPSLQRHQQHQVWGRHPPPPPHLFGGHGHFAFPQHRPPVPPPPPAPNHYYQHRRHINASTESSGHHHNSSRPGVPELCSPPRIRHPNSDNRRLASPLQPFHHSPSIYSPMYHQRGLPPARVSLHQHPTPPPPPSKKAKSRHPS